MVRALCLWHIQQYTYKEWKTLHKEVFFYRKYYILSQKKLNYFWIFVMKLLPTSWKPVLRNENLVLLLPFHKQMNQKILNLRIQITYTKNLI